jgi:hypothetical protein
LRIADCGLRIADCGLRIADFLNLNQQPEIAKYGERYCQQITKSLFSAPEALRILAGGDNHRERGSKWFQAPAGATDPALDVYYLNCYPAPFQRSLKKLPSPGNRCTVTAPRMERERT